VIHFCRVLFGDTTRIWQELKDLCGNVVLTDDQDRCILDVGKKWFFLLNRCI
jgi:hypothetical protein